MKKPLNKLILTLATLCLLMAPFRGFAAGVDVKLSASDKTYLLNLARQTIVWFVEKDKFMTLDSKHVPKSLQKKIGCFVTIRQQRWNLRGRGGVFNTTKPLYQNVIDASLQAAREGDGQTSYMGGRELSFSKIEISLVTNPVDLKFSSADDLLSKLRPKTDGVVLFTRYGSTTSIPKVWGAFPDKKDFLGRLCWMHRAPMDTWKTDTKNIKVQTFQSSWFREKSYKMSPKKPKGAVGAPVPPKHKAVVADNSFSIYMTAQSGQNVRVGNLGAAPVSTFSIGSTGGKERASVTSMGRGDISQYFNLPAGKSGATLVGSYIKSGTKREIYIPASTKNVTIVIQENGYMVQDENGSLPLYPYPQEVQIKAGACDLSAKAIYLPKSSGKKLGAIADALAKQIAHNLKPNSAPKINRGGSAFGGFKVLSVGIAPVAWAKLAPAVSFKKIMPSLKSQAYALIITKDGALIVSPSERGLSYGSVTLTQLMRHAVGKTKLPCLSILDWPNAESRGGHAASPGVSPEDRLQSGKLSWQGRFTTLLWEIRPSMYAGYESHPEVRLTNKRGTSSGKARYKKLAQELNSYGIEFIPMHQASMGHWHQSSCLPHDMMGDSETYYWAMTDMIDEDLEVFRPKSFHLLMDEGFFAWRDLANPARDLTQWRDAAIRLAKHLRRRGVTPMIFSDPLQHASQFGESGRGKDFYKLPESKLPLKENFKQFTSKFPKELVLNNWYYWPTNQRDILKGRGGLSYQVDSGLPVVVYCKAHLYEQHVIAMKNLKEKQPNALGAVVPIWGAARGQHPRFVAGSIGAFWNANHPDKPLDFKSELTLTPTNWACLLDANPPSSVADALKRLSSPDWRVWTQAREELVVVGLPAVPEILAGMSKATKEEIRDRFEGCVSRIARDARLGHKQGTLTVAKVMPCLKDKSKRVRDVAAEVMASANSKNLSSLQGLVADKTSGASAIRAIGIVSDMSAVKVLSDVLSGATNSDEVRAEAARVLGLLNVTTAAATLQSVLKSTKSEVLQKETLWALAMLRVKTADKLIAPFLKSKSQDLRYRAALALTVLGSSEVKGMASWLGKDRQSLELAGWAMFNTLNRKEAQKYLDAGLLVQKDQNSIKRLKQLKLVFAGKSKRSARYR